MALAKQLFPIVRTARDAADLVGSMFDGLGEEKLVVLHLGSDRRLLGLVEGRLEAEAELNLPIRTVVADALRFGSAGLILAHNHPSGDAAPSAADVEATGRWRPCWASSAWRCTTTSSSAAAGSAAFGRSGFSDPPHPV